MGHNSIKITSVNQIVIVILSGVLTSIAINAPPLLLYCIGSLRCRGQGSLDGTLHYFQAGLGDWILPRRVWCMLHQAGETTPLLAASEDNFVVLLSRASLVLLGKGQATRRSSKAGSIYYVEGDNCSNAPTYTPGATQSDKVLLLVRLGWWWCACSYSSSG